jgi:hypothetical protein
MVYARPATDLRAPLPPRPNTAHSLALTPARSLARTPRLLVRQYLSCEEEEEE